jgi:hypothetical protein
LQLHNVALFQETKSSSSAVDSTAAILPLYRAELLYMLACQKSDVECEDDAVFTELCARAAHTELLRLKGDAHADTLACLAALASKLSKQKKPLLPLLLRP